METFRVKIKVTANNQREADAARRYLKSHLPGVEIPRAMPTGEGEDRIAFGEIEIPVEPSAPPRVPVERLPKNCRRARGDA